MVRSDRKCRKVPVQGPKSKKLTQTKDKIAEFSQIIREQISTYNN